MIIPNQPKYNKQINTYIQFKHLNFGSQEWLIKEVKEKLYEAYREEAKKNNISFKDLMIRKDYYDILPSWMESQKEIDENWEFYTDEFIDDEARKILNKQFAIYYSFNF